MRLGDRLGGHIVTGHIDCIATLSKSAISSANRILEFTMPAEPGRYLVRKVP
jgi:riboflavin synthase